MKRRCAILGKAFRDPTYMGTLYSIIFLSHQLGSSMGVWLGGWLYDVYGNYVVVW